MADFLQEVVNQNRLNDANVMLDSAESIIGENIVPYLEDCIDTINISLNDVSAVEYKKLCAPIFGEMAYYALIDFARCCVGHIKNVVLSVVDVIGEDKIKKAQAIADSIGCTLRVRRYEQ